MKVYEKLLEAVVVIKPLIGNCCCENDCVVYLHNV